MRKQEMYRITYRAKDGAVKTGNTDNKAVALERLGDRVISITKLYPFSTEKNQHNFELIKNKAFNLMCDIQSGEADGTYEDIERLESLIDECSQYMCLSLPVAWVDGKTLARCKEISRRATESRVKAVLELGRPDLIKYC